MTLLSLVFPAWSATCPRPATVDEVYSALAAAELAWFELREPDFRAHLSLARARLPCLSERARPELVAAIHRVTGFEAWLGYQGERAVLALSAARSAEPGWVYPAPPSGEPDPPERALYERISVLAPTMEPVPFPHEGSLGFDAVERAARPVGRPALFQYIDGDGIPVVTAYVWPGEPLPDYPRPPERRNGPWVLGGSGVGLVVTGSALAAVGFVRSRDADYQELAAFGDPAAARYWADRVLPWYVAGGVTSGAGLLAAGGAGVWLLLREDGAELGLAGRW